MSASPLKRRAALATLDANAMTATTPTSTTTSPTKATTQQQHNAAAADATCASSPASKANPAPFPSLSGTKRPNLQASPSMNSTSTWTNSFKKSRLEYIQPETQPALSTTTTTRQDSASRSRTHSPDASSVFDSSCAAEDASWATAATEPDVLYASAASRPRVVALTREQAREVCVFGSSLWSFMRILKNRIHIHTYGCKSSREKDIVLILSRLQQKAEILRLRLGLASYKLRTGQVSIPLADLQAKPLPARFASPASGTMASTPTSSPDEAEAEAEEGKDAEQDEVIAATPPMEGEQEQEEEEEEEDEERSNNKPVAASGSAASGLLSLAMGSG